MRLFAACPLEKHIIKSLEKLQDNLKAESENEKIKWMDPANIHLTLKFLGEVEGETKLSAVKNSIRSAVASFSPYEIIIKGGGVFPSPEYPSVLWVGCCDISDYTVKIKKNIDVSLKDTGFKEEKRSFTPHLTIGRIKYRRGRNRAAEKLLKSDIYIGRMSINRVNLYQSRLSPYGAEYSIVEKFNI